MEDDLDILLKENKQQIKYTFLTLEFWKRMIIPIYSFIYLFFYSLVFTNIQKENQRSIYDDRANGGDNRNITRRPAGYRYRSRGGG